MGCRVYVSGLKVSRRSSSLNAPLTGLIAATNAPKKRAGKPLYRPAEYTGECDYDAFDDACTLKQAESERTLRGRWLEDNGPVK